MRPMKDNVAVYLERAERLDLIIPTIDPANGDMISYIGPKMAGAGAHSACRPRWVRSSVPYSPG